MMKVFKRATDEPAGASALAQRLEAIATRHKVGTALYDREPEAPVRH